MSRRWTVATAMMAALIAVFFAPLGGYLEENPLPAQGWMQENLLLACGLFVAASVVIGLVTRQRKTKAAIERKQKVWRNDEPALLDLRAQMRKVWVDGALAESLLHIVPVELNFASRADLLNSPLKLVRQRQREREFSESATVAEIFADEQAERRLLILGAPGSGKTTQLFHLAESLLNQAATSKLEPVPVILPLSAGKWETDLRDLGKDKASMAPAKRDQMESEAVDKIVGWMAGEIAARYQVPRRLARDWLLATKSPTQPSPQWPVYCSPD